MKMKIRLSVFLLVLFSLAAIGVYFWLLIDLPSVETISQGFSQPSVRILDRHGRTLYEVLAFEGGRHVVLPLDEIPENLQKATIATEDRDFYSHPGVDPLGILRAAWINLRGSSTIAGGSTITQQVARNLLLTADERFERSLRRKLREIILAWQLTRRSSKDEILSLYLNQTYYGGLAYGVEAAAQTFFGKPVGQLDLAECALLAGLPQAPAIYNPFTNLDAAKARQVIVLELMENDGWISSEQRVLAERELLVFAETPYPMEAPHFVMMVRAQLDALFSAQEQSTSGGLQVRTTLDLDWQKHAEYAIARQIEEMKNSPDGFGHNMNNAALAALNPYSGEILALVGSPDYFDANIGGAINMAISPRQPGSALKPLVYAAALDPQGAGGGWTAATMLLDVKTSFITHDGKAYIPSNYDLKEHGPVLLREALASSLNIPAVITLDHIGLETLFDLASKLGISALGDPQDYDLSLALGGGEVRLLELAAAYGAFANGGYKVNPVSILEVRDFQGNIIYSAEASPQSRVLDEKIAWLISDILSDNEARRIGFGENSILRLDRPAAVKTGTTTNFHDNWTVGYTPGLVVGVWTGNTNYEPMRAVDGLTGAAPIWHQFMRAVLGESPPDDFSMPAGIVHLEVCALSGMLPTDVCPYRRSEWFIEGTQPAEEDQFYRQVTIDSRSGLIAGADTPPEFWEERVVLDLPPQAYPWAHQEGLILYSDLLVGSSPETEAEMSAPSASAQQPLLRLIAPATFSTYRLSNSMEASAQRIRLEAVAAPELSNVTLWVDGEMIARLSEMPYQVWWTLEAGRHEIWADARLENGELVTSETVMIQVVPVYSTP